MTIKLPFSTPTSRGIRSVFTMLYIGLHSSPGSTADPSHSTYILSLAVGDISLIYPLRSPTSTSNSICKFEKETQFIIFFYISPPKAVAFLSAFLLLLMEPNQPGVKVRIVWALPFFKYFQFYFFLLLLLLPDAIQSH